MSHRAIRQQRQEATRRKHFSLAPVETDDDEDLVPWDEPDPPSCSPIQNERIICATPAQG